jgi:SAM-dependent methyltransferase
MKLSVNKRSTCRVCGSSDLYKFLEFSDIPLVDDFLTRDELGTEFLYPLKLYVCKCCYLVQTQHDVDLTNYYKDFHYSVSLSPFARRFMRSLAQALFEHYDLKSGDSVLEVGSSDGYQLECLRELGAQVFGFEPSASLAAASNRRNIPVAQTLFSPQTIQLIPTHLLPLRMVITTYTFDHIGDPLTFLKSVKRVLDPVRGLLVMEVHDLPKIIEQHEWGLFEHEHPVYYSAHTIQDTLRRGGFEMLTYKLVPESLRRANSMLVVAKPRGGSFLPSVDIYLNSDKWADIGAYTQVGQQVKESLTNFYQFVQAEHTSGHRLAGYGASGRGILTLAMSGVGTREMVYLCDKNPTIHGYYVPKSHIPVVNPQHVFKEWVDKIVVFSFGYLQEIANELTEYTARGGQLISIREVM